MKTVKKQTVVERDVHRSITPQAEALTEEEISRRAYEIYLEGGEVSGSDLDDWLRAERELKLRKAESSRVPE